MRAPPPTSRTKELAEYVSEDVLKSSGKIKPASERTTIAEGRMTELVVLSSFLRIGEYLISLGNVLEFFLCLLVARIPIRMKL